MRDEEELVLGSEIPRRRHGLHHEMPRILERGQLRRIREAEDLRFDGGTDATMPPRPRAIEEREDATLGGAPFPARDEAIDDAELHADVGVARASTKSHSSLP